MESLIDEKSVVNQVAKLALQRTKELREEEQMRYLQEEGMWLSNMKERNAMFVDSEILHNKRVKLVVTTPMTEEEYMNTDEYKALVKQVYNNTTIVSDNEIVRWVDVEIIHSNTDGLPLVYNQFFTKEYKDWIVCFIHDDLILEDINFLEKLHKAHKEADVVGLAGATELELPFKLSKRSTWNEMASVTKDLTGIPRKSMSGFVAHQNGDRVWGTSFGESGQYCRLIDGLFMSFDIEKCVEQDFSFDTRFSFHHYDISACIKAQQKGLKIKTAPIHVIHKGMGDLDKSWVESHKQFVAVYDRFGLE